MKSDKSRSKMNAKLVIDLAKMGPQGQSSIRCSYKHHPENKGFDTVLERVRFSLICRRCESAPCVAACPRGALEKVSSGGNNAGVLKRANMLCTGCGTCALACPFGTIYADLMPFASSVCDLCEGRLSPGEQPLCVRTCRDGSVEYKAVEPADDLVEVVENVVVRIVEGSVWKPFLRNKQEAGK
jgi:Fe-S-cluster-containing dehydrogenase component